MSILKTIAVEKLRLIGYEPDEVSTHINMSKLDDIKSTFKLKQIVFEGFKSGNLCNF